VLAFKNTHLGKICHTDDRAKYKGVLGVRQFLLRGLENVRTEWRWLCTTYNLKKLRNFSITP
jgi:hypothetical protein